MLNTNKIVAGSKVRCVNASEDSSESLKKGKVYTVGVVFTELYLRPTDLVGEYETLHNPLLKFKTPKVVLDETVYPYFFDMDRFELVQE